MENNNSDYNNEPVYYCSKCLSLNIKSTNTGIDFCDGCGSIDILTASIENWKELYKGRYNKYLINN